MLWRYRITKSRMIYFYSNMTQYDLFFRTKFNLRIKEEKKEASDISWGL